MLLHPHPLALSSNTTHKHAVTSPLLSHSISEHQTQPRSRISAPALSSPCRPVAAVPSPPAHLLFALDASLSLPLTEHQLRPRVGRRERLHADRALHEVRHLSDSGVQGSGQVRACRAGQCWSPRSGSRIQDIPLWPAAHKGQRLIIYTNRIRQSRIRSGRADNQESRTGFVHHITASRICTDERRQKVCRLQSKTT